MSLVAGYQCNGDTLDFSGNGRTATAIGATFTTPGKVYAQAAFFDNIDDRWTIPATGISLDNQAFSCGGWVNFSQAIGAFDFIMGNGSVASAANLFHVYMRREDTGKFRIGLGKTGVWGVTFLTNSAILTAKDTDFHIFLTYDGSRTVGGIKIYVDGAEPASTSSGTFGSVANASDAWILGDDVSISAPLGGKQNQMLLYDEEVSAATISGLWNGGAGIFLPITAAGGAIINGGMAGDHVINRGVIGV